MFGAASVCLLLVAAGCVGTNRQKPVAVVCGELVQRGDLDDLIGQAQRAYKANGQRIPREGTRAFLSVRDHALAFLIQRAEFAYASRDLGIEVSNADVDRRIATIIGESFGGDRQRYELQLAKRGLNDDLMRVDARADVISQRLYARVTRRAATVTAAEVRRYYRTHLEQYTIAVNRDVEQIVVRTRGLARALRAKLEGGSDFEMLAKRFSIDAGAASGGYVTVRKGEATSPFAAAFRLETGEVSQPIRGGEGWQLVKAVSDIRPRSYQALEDVQAPIRQQLIDDHRQRAMTRWAQALARTCSKRLTYSPGYQPVAAP